VLRRLVAVILGIIAGAIIVSLIEGLGRALWPAPKGFNYRDPEALRAFMRTMPIGASLSVVAAWVLGAFGGAWMAATISRSWREALVVGFFILCMVVITLVQIPHPLWMSVLGVLLPMPAAWLASRLTPKVETR
jgi:hypothetical protein